MPPYATPNRSDEGLLFRELRQWLEARNLAVTVTPVFLPPARARQLVNASDWCLSFFPPPDHRAHSFHRIDDATVRIGLVRRARPADFTWNDPGYFSNSSIAVLRSGNLGEMWRPMHRAGARFVYVDTMEQGLRMVQMGRVDYTFADQKGLEVFTGDHPAGPLLQFSKIHLKEYPVGIYVSDHCKGLLETDTASTPSALSEGPLQN